MIKKEYILLAVLSAGFSFPVQGQTTWTKQDSIKLKEILDGQRIYPLIPLSNKKSTCYFPHPHRYTVFPFYPLRNFYPSRKISGRYTRYPDSDWTIHAYITTPNDGINIYWTLSDSVSQPLRNMAKEQGYFYSKRQISSLTSLKSSAIMFTQAIAAAAVNPPYCREQ